MVETATALQGITTWLTLQLNLQKAVALFGQVNLYLMMRDMVQLVNSMNMDPLLNLICCLRSDHYFIDQKQCYLEYCSGG